MARFELTEDGRLFRPLAPSLTGIVVAGTRNGKGWRVIFDGNNTTKVLPKSHINIIGEFVEPLKCLVRPYKLDNLSSFEDFRRRIVRDYIKANPKPKEFVLISENINVYRAYEKLTKTGYYENTSNK